MPANVLHNRVRAFDMGPGTYVMVNEKRLKIHKTKVVTGSLEETFLPGQIAKLTNDEFVIQTGENQLSILLLQPESKPRLSVQEYVKNINFKKGDYFV
jgi:methionyl-tRNA formyltransferase